jgi:hypothetical protein
MGDFLGDFMSRDVGMVGWYGNYRPENILLSQLLEEEYTASSPFSIFRRISNSVLPMRLQAMYSHGSRHSGYSPRQRELSGAAVGAT